MFFPFFCGAFLAVHRSELSEILRRDYSDAPGKNPKHCTLNLNPNHNAESSLLRNKSPPPSPKSQWYRGPREKDFAGVPYAFLNPASVEDFLWYGTKANTRLSCPRQTLWPYAPKAPHPKQAGIMIQRFWWLRCYNTRVRNPEEQFCHITKSEPRTSFLDGGTANRRGGPCSSACG